jgi:hypothetical protein
MVVLGLLRWVNHQDHLYMLTFLVGQSGQENFPIFLNCSLHSNRFHIPSPVEIGFQYDRSWIFLRDGEKWQIKYLKSRKNCCWFAPEDMKIGDHSGVALQRRQNPAGRR